MSSTPHGTLLETARPTSAGEMLTCVASLVIYCLSDQATALIAFCRVAHNVCGMAGLDTVACVLCPLSSRPLLLTMLVHALRIVSGRQALGAEAMPCSRWRHRNVLHPVQVCKAGSAGKCVFSNGAVHADRLLGGMRSTPGTT